MLFFTQCCCLLYDVSAFEIARPSRVRQTTISIPIGDQMSDMWWYRQFGVEYGPMSLSELKDKLRGVDAREVLVLRYGSKKWKRVEELPEFRTEAQQLSESNQKIERERDEQLRSWVVLISVITAIGVGLGSMAQLHLDPFVGSVLGLVAGLLVGRACAVSK
jgi:hypothetical protein